MIFGWLEPAWSSALRLPALKPSSAVLQIDVERHDEARCVGGTEKGRGNVDKARMEELDLPRALCRPYKRVALKGGSYRRRTAVPVVASTVIKLTDSDTVMQMHATCTGLCLAPSLGRDP